MKKTLFMGTLAASVAPIVASVSCSSPLPQSGSLLEFWNYEDYIAEDAKDKLYDEYKNYYEFGDLPELKQGILDKRIAAGVGSDYFNAQLAGMGLLAKIDFAKLYGITDDKTQWAAELEKIYTKAVWKQLNSFEVKKYQHNNDGSYSVILKDGNPITDVDGDGKEDKLWEYMIPYFTQNKVIAINPFKITKNPTNSHLLDILQGNDQAAIASEFATNNTYKGILDKLHQNGFSKLMINDYFRDNLMIGSENADGSFFSGDVPDKVTGKKYINGFLSLIQGWNVIDWETSGVKSLNSLLPGYTTNAEVSMLYNGDALYASAGGSLENADDIGGQIRVIIPKNPTFLLDGVVIPKYVDANESERDNLYENLKSSIYNGATLKSSQSDELDESPIYQNFDYVNYAPAFSGLHEHVMSTYFINDDNTEDSVGKYILGSTENMVNSIDEHHITQPIKEGVETYIEGEFKKHHKNGQH